MVQKEAGGAERVTLSFSFFPSFPFSRTDHALKPNLNVTCEYNASLTRTPPIVPSPCDNPVSDAGVIMRSGDCSQCELRD
jgi:hypothetical protein